MNRHVTIIAEAGVNHNGSRARALELVDAAAEAGADMVKFQTFKADKLASARAAKAAYQQRNAPGDPTQLDMLRALELSDEDHEVLIARCEARSITFLSTPFDPGSLDLLAQRFHLATIKLGSGELTNGPLLLQAAQTGRKLIVSTGMGDLAEVEDALAVLAFGYTGSGAPSRKAFQSAFTSSAGQVALKEKVTLLHCTTEYPTPLADINLAAMDTLRQRFGLAVGFSDHSEGIVVAIAAAARGATVIEKHFTLDRNLPGPDHKASVEPAALKAMVEGIRAVELACGDGVKIARPSEAANKTVARKVIVAARDIAQGQVISADDITILRAGAGLSPMAYWDVVGSRAPRATSAGEPLEP
ncbi:MAG: N-acetylneuraminate synthase [Rhizobiales bacterium]|nr:N-acetylneuraminate synthase [Hyphomicrobiales bacterium]